MAGQQPTLHGAGIVLRPWTSADVDAVYEACQDAEIQRWTTVPSPYQRSDALSFVCDVAPGAWERGGAVYAVVDATGGALIGSIGAESIRDGVAHVGYWTARPARGRGHTSEALRTFALWLLDDRDAARVELVVEPANIASRRVADAAGFVAEGVLRRRMVLHGERIDVIVYSRLPSDGIGTSSPG